MTRPKADSDPWLTDPISRDRVVAKATVHGIREILVTLREIRDDLGRTRALEAENREIRGELRDLWAAVRQQKGFVPQPRPQMFPPCEREQCVLPEGHPGNHRASIRHQ